MLSDPEAIHQVDGLGRNVVMYTIHGNSVAHIECLEILINMNCDLNIQANGKSQKKITLDQFENNKVGQVFWNLSFSMQ